MKVLADTSVWIGHFRVPEPGLIRLLEQGSVLTHAFVIGEIACGNLRQRDRVLAELNLLPTALAARHGEAMELLNARKLAGRGIGWIDLHLIASALLTGCALWTLDERLRNAAHHVGVTLYGAVGLVN